MLYFCIYNYISVYPSVIVYLRQKDNFALSISLSRTLSFLPLSLSLSFFLSFSLSLSLSLSLFLSFSFFLSFSLSLLLYLRSISLSLINPILSMSGNVCTSRSYSLKFHISQSLSHLNDNVCYIIIYTQWL